jgi:hypothetical protein
LDSYHDAISEAAKAIERERAKTYVVGATGKMGSNALTKRPSVVLTEAESLYIEAAHYKIVRAWHFTADRIKMLDDLIDAYNYIAMAYSEVEKNGKADASTINALKAEVAELKAFIEANKVGQ